MKEFFLFILNYIKWSIKENKVLLLLFLSHLVMVIYVVIPDGPEKMSFPYSDQLITDQSKVYYAQEHISRSILIFALLLAMPENKRMMWVFIALESVTLIDYVVRYNEDILVPNFNIDTIKLVVYGTLIFSTIRRNNRKLYEGKA